LSRAPKSLSDETLGWHGFIEAQSVPSN